jgi:hypothetical protein
MQDFSGQNLQGRDFKRQDLTYANFVGADIRGANFSQAILHNADFTGVTAGLAPGWRIPAMLWGLGLCGLELELTFGAGYILFFFNPLSAWMLADLVIHPLLTLIILKLSFNLLAIAGWSRRAILICQIMLTVLSAIVASWGVVQGGLNGWEAYWAAGHARAPDSGIVESFVGLLFISFCIARTGCYGDAAWKYVKQSRQQQSTTQPPPNHAKNSLLQTATIGILGPGVTCFHGADLTGANFTDANLQDTKF